MIFDILSPEQTVLTWRSITCYKTCWIINVGTVFPGCYWNLSIKFQSNNLLELTRKFLMKVKVTWRFYITFRTLHWLLLCYVIRFITQHFFVKRSTYSWNLPKLWRENRLHSRNNHHNWAQSSNRKFVKNSSLSESLESFDSFQNVLQVLVTSLLLFVSTISCSFNRNSM